MIDRHKELLMQCILTGQVPNKDVPKILRDDPDFASYYAKCMGQISVRLEEDFNKQFGGPK